MEYLSQVLNLYKEEPEPEPRDHEETHVYITERKFCPFTYIPGLNEGQGRHNRCFYLACKSRDLDFSESYALNKALTVWNPKNCPPLEEHEVKHAVYRAYHKYPKKPFKITAMFKLTTWDASYNPQKSIDKVAKSGSSVELSIEEIEALMDGDIELSSCESVESIPATLCVFNPTETGFTKTSYYFEEGDRELWEATIKEKALAISHRINVTGLIEAKSAGYDFPYSGWTYHNQEF